MFYQITKQLFKIVSVFLIICVKLFAAGMDTIRIPSPCMKKSFNALIVLPDSYHQSTKKYPVLYLLHGHSSGPASWYLVIPEIKAWANTYQLILVCPDGDYDSWYINSPQHKNRMFETYFASEIIQYIDCNYRTIPKRNSRGISGISMGGHGAVFLGLKHPDVFGSIGSSSGGLDLLAFYNEWNLLTLIGTYKNKTEAWKKYSCYYILDQINKTDQTIWIDCGTEDFFINVNRSFHQKLLKKNIRHEYHEFPGEHNLEYWKESYKKQIKFLSQKLIRD